MKSIKVSDETWETLMQLKLGKKARSVEEILKEILKKR